VTPWTLGNPAAARIEFLSTEGSLNVVNTFGFARIRSWPSRSTRCPAPVPPLTGMTSETSGSANILSTPAARRSALPASHPSRSSTPSATRTEYPRPSR
jgi:hypothetical protein